MVTLDRAPEAAPAGRAGREGWLDAALVSAPATLAIALGLIDLTGRSLWLDEAATVAIAGQHGSSLWSAIAHDGGNMLGYYALMHVLIGWFGHGALAIRLASVLAAGACAAGVSLLGLRLFDRRAAVAAGLLSAVSLPLVFWGQDARGYALMVALVVWSFVALAAVLDRPARRGWWIAYVLFTGLSLYASFVAVFALLAQLVALGWRRDGWRRVISALGVCALGWIPLLVLALERGSGQLFWIPRPSLRTEGQVLQALSSAGFEPNFRPTFVSTALAIVTVGLLLAAAVRVLRALRFGPLLVLCWLAVPVVLMWLWSLVGQPIFTPRNLLVSLPAVALLAGWVIMSMPGRLAWPALALLLAARAVALVPSYGVSPENWRSAAAYVAGAQRPGDCLAFYPLDARMPFAYYTGQPVTPYVERYDTPALPAGCSRVWLVASHEGQPDGPPVSREHYGRFVALRSELTREYGPPRTRSFGYASVIWVEVFGPRE